MFYMADVILTVGAEFSIDYSQFQSQITKAISQIEVQTQKIKVGFDPASIKSMQSQLQALYSTTGVSSGTSSASTAAASAATAAAKSSAQASKEAASAAQQQATAERELATATQQRASAESQSTAASTQAAKAEKDNISVLKQYYTTITQLESALQRYTAAKTSSNESSRTAYSSMQSEVTNLKTLFATYDGSTSSINKMKTALGQAQVVLKSSASVIKENNDATKSWADRMGGLASKFSSWFTISQTIMLAIRSIRELISASIEVDDALTQLKIVTNETDEAYAQFGDTISATAQKIGSSISDIVDSTTTYARLGYDLEESSTLAEYTAMLQNVGDIDVSDAQDALTSIIKAFGISTDDIETVMDELIAVGNNYPISVSQIAEGMTNASSTLAAAGNSLEESIALLTAANTTIQDASKSSTGLRTITARIRNTTTELDELGETMTEANYEELVSSLTDANVALTDANGEYRSTYDIMKDIAAQWDTMTSMEQAAMATALSGTRQQAVFYSIIEQFQEASGAMETMSESAGTLDDSYSTYMDSITAHINQFKAAFQGLGTDLFNSEMLKGIVDFGTTVVSALDKVIDTLGSIPTLVAAITAAFSITKNAGRDKMFSLNYCL